MLWKGVERCWCGSCSGHLRASALAIDRSSRMRQPPDAVNRLEMVVGRTLTEGRTTKAMVLIVLRAIEQGVRLATLRRWSVDVVGGVEEGACRVRSRTKGVARPLRRRADHTHAVGAANRNREWTLRVGVGDVDWRQRGIRREAGSRHHCLRVGVANSAIVLLDLGLDATTVRRMADRRQDWANIVEHDALRLLIGKVHGSLHDIVGEGVAEKLLKLNLTVDLRDEQTLCLWAGAANAFLDHV